MTILSTTDNLLMPLKWKVFRVVNFVTLIATLTIFCIGSFAFWGPADNSNDEVMYYILFVICTIILCTNYGNNIHLVENYYPSKLISKNYNSLINLLMLGTSLLVALFSILFAFVITTMFDSDNIPGSDETGRILLIAGSGLYLAASYYIIWFQINLKSQIIHNHGQELDKFLDSNT